MSSPACCSPEKSMEKTLTMHRMQTMQGKTRLSRRCAKKCAKVCRAPGNGKSHEESCDSSWDFGALEGTRIPGPLIKSQMLYRLSYERIFCSNTILPNNITINADKMQVPGRKFLRCTYEVPRGDFKRPNDLAAGEMERFYPDKILFTKPDRIVTIKVNPIWALFRAGSA